MSFNELRNGRVSITHQEYLITFVTKNRKPLFTDLQTCSIAIKEILDLKEGVWLAWVLMPDHFHGLIRLGDLTLAQEIGRCKSKSAIKINRHLNRQGQLWQTSFHDRALRNESERLKVARYIVVNPLRSKLVGQITDYPYWNSIWIYGELIDDIHRDCRSVACPDKTKISRQGKPLTYKLMSTM